MVMTPLIVIRPVLKCFFPILVMAVMGLLNACTPQIVDLGPPQRDAQLLRAHLSTADGLALPYRSWMPSESPRAIIIALHGFNDYSNFFDDPAQFFAANGIASYAYDQRGFGAAPFRGRWFMTDSYIADAKAFTKLIAQRHSGVPIYVLGESMGGAVTMSLVTEVETPWIEGVILSAPAVWGRDAMPFYQTSALWLGAHTFPSTRLTGRGLKVTPSNNIEMLRAMGRDPLVIKGARIDAIYGLVDLMDRALNSAYTFDKKALILYGARDDIVKGGPTRMMFDRLPRTPTQPRRIAIYKGGYHMLLRDLAAQKIWNDILHWIDTPDVPLPSGADKDARKRLSVE
jgi:acylglycerol lipase